LVTTYYSSGILETARSTPYIQTGASLGPLKNRRGESLAFNGLSALFSFDHRLYFTAGIGDESHGLFGFIKRSEEQDDHDSHE
jgi:hypothetical protein